MKAAVASVPNAASAVKKISTFSSVGWSVNVLGNTEQSSHGVQREAREMRNKDDKFRRIEREGYFAALNKESKAQYQYKSREERMAFDIGYYKGTLEISRQTADLRIRQKECERDLSKCG
jgi:hypothetical protein|uniref:Uncharacterized protein n=1 Tax=Podoviridae sp. ctrub15 TaxID=2826581 RepID=A0A8S5LV27_9CAUD|nr:MAG TPA: hypothetical protein [Podoviridae sp. ctrub15]